MPVKKTKKTPEKKGAEKKSKRAPAKRKPRVSRKDRAEIKKAIGALPGMIVEELHRPVDPPTRPPVQSTVNYGSRGYQKRQRLVWLGAGILALAIFGAWIYSIRATIGGVLGAPSLEGQLYRDARSDFSQILDSFSAIEEQIEQEAEAARTQPSPEDAKAAIKEQLLLLMVSSSQVTGSSTAASSTPEKTHTSTTTPVTSTNQQ